VLSSSVASEATPSGGAGLQRVVLADGVAVADRMHGEDRREIAVGETGVGGGVTESRDTSRLCRCVTELRSGS